MGGQPRLLCRYGYDPLDRVAALAPADANETRLFYQKSRLATQIQEALQHSILQVDNHLLAQFSHRQKKIVETALLVPDGLRSVVHVVSGGQHQTQVYTAYGYHAPNSGLHSLLGFAGERCDPVTGHYLLGNGYRAFNPVLMRFNSPDSLSPFDRGGLNAYAYCQGDPLSFRDPTGHIRVVPPSLLFRGVKVGPLKVALKRLKSKTPVSWKAVSSGNKSGSIIKPSQRNLAGPPSRLVRPANKKLSVPAYKQAFLNSNEKEAYEQLLNESRELETFVAHNPEIIADKHFMRRDELKQSIHDIHSSVGYVRRSSFSEINVEQALKATEGMTSIGAPYAVRPYP